MARLRARKAGHADELSVVEHLDELRTRIIVSATVLAVSVGLCFWQNELLLRIANGPLPGAREPITFGVTEPFFTTLKLSFYAGVLLALPVLLYQAYAFILPAFKPSEKRVVLPLLMMVPALFIAGAVFATSGSRSAAAGPDGTPTAQVDVKDVDPGTCDLSVKNPNGGEVVKHRSPGEILDEITALDQEAAEALKKIRGLL